MIKFITGNKNKFAEVKKVLSEIPLELVDIDLTEIQSLDAHEIIQHKLEQARQQLLSDHVAFDGIIVEDTSLYFECLNNHLPGPLIKWFLETLKPKGLAQLVANQGNSKAYGVTLIGYVDKTGQVKFFEGRNDGIIVSPRGDKDFGWGPIFQPVGHDRTYGEMEREEKYATSMRGLASKQLKDFLLTLN